MNLRFSIGVDPDTTKTAVAIVVPPSKQGEVYHLAAAYMIKQKGKKDRQATLAILDAMINTCEDEDNMPQADNVIAFAVEGQQIYKGKDKKGKDKTPNPNSILWLAPISGAFLTLFTSWYPKALRLFPSPNGWKGSTPKQIHHGRIGTKMGWEMKPVGTPEKGYAYPVEPTMLRDCGTINKEDWKHLMDAIGLAQYAAEQADKLKARIAVKEGSK